MKKADRIFHVRNFLAQFEKIEHKDGKTDAVGWIALKFSCSREQAEKWIREASPSSTPSAAPD